MTCGTGSQVFHLYDRGFDIRGLEFSPKMIEIAKEKARQRELDLGHLMEGDNITKLTIDWQKEKRGKKYREIQYSTINKEGVLASYDIYHEESGKSDPKITDGFMTLQIYSIDELTKMLSQNGFEVLEIIHIDNYSNPTNKPAERYIIVSSKV